MANNHAADYGSGGLAQTLAAIKHSPIPVIGIGKDADAAFAPWYTTVRGLRIAIIAADQVRDESTLPDFSAEPGKPGVANAYRPQLFSTVRAARARADIVIVYLHWGTEYHSCPNAEQPPLADALVKAGATAVVGTHAHVLLGAGWRKDGSYVAYGLSNYLWWMSFGNEQDDNGVLTLNFVPHKVIAAHFVARASGLPRRPHSGHRHDQGTHRRRVGAGTSLRRAASAPAALSGECFPWPSVLSVQQS